MPASNLRTPSYRLHKPTGLAVVTLDGRDIYLGRFGSAESRPESIGSGPSGSPTGGASRRLLPAEAGGGLQ